MIIRILVAFALLLPLALNGSAVDRITIIKHQNGDTLGSITDKRTITEWLRAAATPDTPYEKLADPVSMPVALVTVVLYNSDHPLAAYRILLYDSFVSKEAVSVDMVKAKLKIENAYIIARNPQLTELAISYLEENAEDFLKTLDSRGGLTKDNLREKAKLVIE